MRLCETTNGRLAEALTILNTLRTWAYADAEHAAEHDAPETAKDDRRRAKQIQRAIELLKACER